MSVEISIHRLYTIPNVIVGVFNIALNSYLIHALRKLDRINNISFKLVTLLSVLDITVGIVFCAHELAYRFATTETAFFVLRMFSAVFLYTTCELSGFTILLIAVDRFVHMKYRMEYPNIVTSRRVTGAVIINVFLALSHTAVEIYAYLFDHLFAGHLVVSCVVFIVLMALSISYIATYTAVRHSAPPAVQAHAQDPRPVPVRDAASELSRAVMVILTTMWIVYVPIAVAAPMKYHHSFKDNHRVLHFFFLAEIILFFNSTLNAAIFIAFNTQLREYTLRLLRG